MVNGIKLHAALAAVVLCGMMPAAHAARTMRLNASDRHFAREAVTGNRSEVLLGSLAVKRGASASVKQFGRQMVADHSKALDAFKKLAARKHTMVPSGVGSATRKTYARLSKLTGDAFDRAYVRDMVEDHVHDVEGFKTAARIVKDPDLKALTKKTLPVLQHHLTMIRKISAGGSM
jgi:putative membrane protein